MAPMPTKKEQMGKGIPRGWPRCPPEIMREIMREILRKDEGKVPNERKQ